MYNGKKLINKSSLRKKKKEKKKNSCDIWTKNHAFPTPSRLNEVKTLWTSSAKNMGLPFSNSLS